MKASVQYNDLIGTVAADLSDSITNDNDLQELLDYFKIDKNRYRIFGISLYGTSDFHSKLICVDKVKSTDMKKHIVTIRIDSNEENMLDLLFKRFHVVLFERFNDKYHELDYDEEISLEDNSEKED